MYLFATICTNKFYVKIVILVLNTYKLSFFKGIRSPMKAFEKNKSRPDQPVLTFGLVLPKSYTLM